MAHDFERYPELTNAQMDLYYWESPHKQIFSDFRANVTKVHDGDTVSVKWQERDFEFPIRMAKIGAPELNETGGKEAQSFLENMLLNEDIDILIDPNNRVEKWGRLLGTIHHKGLDVGTILMNKGHAKPFEERNEGKILGIIPELKLGS